MLVAFYMPTLKTREIGQHVGAHRKPGEEQKNKKTSA